MHKHAWFVAATVVLICVASNSAFAWPFSDCQFKAERQAAVNLAGAKSILINAGAGDLTVRGAAGAAGVSAHGKACASTQALLAATTLRVAREGDVIRVDTLIPKTEDKVFNRETAYIDLEVSIPAELRVTINDSSGDARIEGIAGGEVRDTSGDLLIAHVAGALDVADSSGDLRLDDVRGALSIADSSGDIDVRNAGADVLVRSDSSGDMNFAGVAGDLHIESDSSGDINASAVKGSVKIDNDSSGDVSVSDIGGDFVLANKGPGEVHVSGVRGRTEIPAYKRD